MGTVVRHRGLYANYLATVQRKDFMRLIFAFDPRKAVLNLRKHGISFVEAMTVFNDPLAATLPDEDHSSLEERLITIGMSTSLRILRLVHTYEEPRIVSSAPGARPYRRGSNMKKTKQPPKPLDFSKAVRGRFFELAQQGTNIVLIEPDLIETFPTSEAVNAALRSVKAIADSAITAPSAS